VEFGGKCLDTVPECVLAERTVADQQARGLRVVVRPVACCFLEPDAVLGCGVEESAGVEFGGQPQEQVQPGGLAAGPDLG
jgi:hypothetical protein